MRLAALIFIITSSLNTEGTVYFCFDRKTYNSDFLASNVEIDTLKNDLKEILLDNDTIHRDHVEFDFDHPALAANGSFDDLDIAHLTQFSINSNINLPVIELVNITFHNISFVGKYDLFGVVGQLFDIYGNGSFWANMINFSVSIKTGIKINTTELCIPITVDVDVQRVDSYFENIMDGDDMLCPLMNRAISSLGQEAVGIIWSDVKNKVDGDLQEIIDSILHRNAVRETITKLIIMASKNHENKLF